MNRSHIGPHGSLGPMASLRATRDRLLKTFAAGFPYSRFALASGLVAEAESLRCMFCSENYKDTDPASMLLRFPQAMDNG